MTGETVAEARWRALDRDGEDRCRLARVSGGWLLVGHARFHDGDGWAALDYVVRCDDAWHTLSADVAGQHGEREVMISLEQSAGRWWLNGALQRQVDTAYDVDLAFTPATNLMPVRRLETVLETRAAWLTYPECRVRPLDQIYRRLSPRSVIYAAQQTGFTTQLAVAQSGFVTLYPGLWQEELQDAG